VAEAILIFDEQQKVCVEVSPLGQYGKFLVAGCGSRVTGYGLRVVGCGLWVVGCGLRLVQAELFAFLRV